MSTLVKPKTLKRRKLLEQREPLGSVVANLWQTLDPVMLISTAAVLLPMAIAPFFLMALFRSMV